MTGMLVGAPSSERRRRSSPIVGALWHHLVGIVSASGAACAAAGTAETFILVVKDQPQALPEQVLLAAVAIAFTLVALTIGAAVLTLPAVMVCYPIAVLVARRLQSGVRTVVAGALLGPVVGTAATITYQSLFIPGPSPVPLLEQVRFLTIPAICVGATMGWVVTTLERRRAPLGGGTR
jgi:hypothetical protein